MLKFPLENNFLNPKYFIIFILGGSETVSLEENIENSEGDSIMCEICGKEERGKDNMDIHMKTHVGAFCQCDQSEEILLTKGLVLVHVKDKHNNATKESGFQSEVGIVQEEQLLIEEPPAQPEGISGSSWRASYTTARGSTS